MAGDILRPHREKGEQGYGPRQPLPLQRIRVAPATQTDTFKLAKESLSLKVWVIFQRATSALGPVVGDLPTTCRGPLRTVSQLPTAW